MLASRLGVAALIIIVLSVFTGNRPLISVDMDEDQPTESGTGEPSVTIGPLKFKHGELINEEELEAVRQSVEALRESDILDEKDLQIIEMRLDRESAEVDMARELEREAEALEAAGREIAQQLAAVRVAPSNNTQPDRLSEEEIQNLVVQRLLSVQTQIREDEESASDSSSASETTSASSAATQVIAAAPEAPVAPTAPVLPIAPPVPASSASERTLERLTGTFAGQTHMGSDFRNKDLSGLDFSNARLTASQFNGSDLTGANFSGAKLHGASFADAIMDRINLSNAQAQTAHFERASMVEANLNHANFAGAVLTDADLRDATMESLNLNGAELQGTILDEAP